MKITKKMNLVPEVFIGFAGHRNLESALKKHKFKINNITANELPNGFIRVQVSWNSDSYMKYPTLCALGSSGDSAELHLDFPLVEFRYSNKAKYRVSMEVKIHTNDRSNIKYHALFFENWKYCVAVYFAPKGWDQIKIGNYNKSIFFSKDY